MAKTSSRQKLAYGLIFVMLLSAIFWALPKFRNDQPDTPIPSVPKSTVPVPTFSGDSAFIFVKKQVDFGPRVPGSAAHKACAAWLSSEFKRHGMTVIEQRFKAPTTFGALDAVNIIAQYKPELKERILLCAHWDSRHIADKDTKNKNNPILGADDGASGVGVLLELARMVKENPVNIGIDFICFDAEDLGVDRQADEQASMMQNTDKTWCLGSQYWAANLHKPGYTAQFGILFDMVGAIGARFPREGNSIEFAMPYVNKIWGVAAELGYSDLFVNIRAGAVTDDHVFVYRGSRIPTVDIIGMPKDPPVFGDHHHTHFDNLSIIDSDVMRKVGHVAATVIYRTAAATPAM